MEETFDVYEDEDGNEYVLVDGAYVPYDPDAFEPAAVEGADPDSADFNPLAYDNVQVATDVANDLARAGGSIAREGAELAGELKDAMDDINAMLDFRNWLK